MFPLRGHIGVDGRISRWLRESSGSTLWEAFVEREQSLCNVWAGRFWQRKVVSQRSGGLSLAATLVSQGLGGPPFIADNRLSPLGETVVYSRQPFLAALGPRATSGARPTAASSRNSLPASSAAGVVQVPRPYSVSGADGRAGHSGLGKCHNSPRTPLVRLAAAPRGGFCSDAKAER